MGKRKQVYSIEGENFMKKIKKALIDKEMTFGELRAKTTYETDWGLRRAILTSNKSAINQVEKILSFF